MQGSASPISCFNLCIYFALCKCCMHGAKLRPSANGHGAL